MTTVTQRAISRAETPSIQVDMPSMPKPNGEPFYERAKSVYNDSALDRDLREQRAYNLLVADFMEHNGDMADKVLKHRMAELYAREQLDSLKCGSW